MLLISLLFGTVSQKVEMQNSEMQEKIGLILLVQKLHYLQDFLLVHDSHVLYEFLLPCNQ